MGLRFLGVGAAILAGTALGYSASKGVRTSVLVVIAITALMLIALFGAIELRRSGWGDLRLFLESVALVLPFIALAIAIYPKGWAGWVGIGGAATNVTAFVRRHRAQERARRTARRAPN